MWDIRTSYTAPAHQEPSLEAQLLKGIVAFKRSEDRATRKQCEEELHEIMARVGGPEDVELVSTLIAVLKLGSKNLAVSALNALANLDGEGARAVPAVLEAGLSGKRMLLINASCTLKAIRDPASVAALVELCEKPDPLGRFQEADEKSEKYRKLRCHALENFTLAAFLEHGQACAPFISRVEDALCAIRPERTARIVEKLNGLRVSLRRERSREYCQMDLPDDLDLDPLREDLNRRVESLVEIPRRRIEKENNPLVAERFRFTVRHTKSEVGLEIHELVGYTGLRHLVVAVQDGDAFGVEVHSVMPVLASAIGARYGLDPRTTYWGVHTTRESGLTSGRCDEYKLYVLKNDPDTGRYNFFHEFQFVNLPELVDFLNVSYNL